MASRGSLLGSVFLALGLFVIVFAFVGYAMGWLHFQRTAEKTTIEIETRQIEQATQDAVQTSKDLMRNAGGKLQDVGEEIEEKTTETGDTTETSDTTETDVPQQPEAVVE